MKKLIKIIIFTILIGSVFSFLSINSDYYNSLIKPFIIPPIVFPIVWTILYILMGISFYLIEDKGDTKSYVLYFLQLIVNSLWTLIFFGLKLKLLSVLWIVLLIILVVLMMINFHKKNKISAYLNIPYLIWLLFALYLSSEIFKLN